MRLRNVSVGRERAVIDGFNVEVNNHLGSLPFKLWRGALWAVSASGALSSVSTSSIKLVPYLGCEVSKRPVIFYYYVNVFCGQRSLGRMGVA